MKDTLSDEALRDMLERKLRKFKELAEDLSHFDRQSEGHDHNTYKFLVESITRAIGRQQMLRNRQGRDDLIKKGGHDPNALPSAPDKAKAEAAAKAKAKAKAKAQSEADKAKQADPKAKTKAKAKPKAKAEGGGSGRGRSSSRGFGDDGVQKVCTYFNHDCGCKKGVDCNFKHVIVSADEKKKLPPPRSTSPAGGKGSGGGSGKGRGRGSGKGGAAAPAGSVRQWCAFFLKEGGCTNEGTCKFPHVSAEAVEAIKKANKAAKE